MGTCTVRIHALEIWLPNLQHGMLTLDGLFGDSRVCVWREKEQNRSRTVFFFFLPSKLILGLVWFGLVWFDLI